MESPTGLLHGAAAPFVILIVPFWLFCAGSIDSTGAKTVQFEKVCKIYVKERRRSLVTIRSQFR